MRFAQIVSSYSPGDAVSNSARNLGEVLQENSVSTQLFAEHIHPKVSSSASMYSKFNPKHWDGVLYHFAFYSNVAEELVHWTSTKRYILYHNVTPSHYFRGYDENTRQACKDAREQLYMLKDHVDCAFAVSQYNANELKAIGYKNIQLLPIWFDSKLNLQQADEKLQQRLNDGFVNLLFVGRLTPHKCQHDLLKIFYIYKTYINPNSRLILVGGGLDKYVSELRGFVRELGLKDVVITGHVNDSELATYYQNASVLLSMSEHEGFCVPLLEAMNFKVPIIAYDAAAIGETLGDSGIKITEKNYNLIAELIHEVIGNENLRTRIIDNEVDRLNYFKIDHMKKIILDSLTKAGIHS